MPRNQPSRSNDSAQLSVRCDGDLKESYKDVLDARERSMSDDLRDYMERVVREHGGDLDTEDGALPSDDELAQAYLALDSLADPDRRQVSVEVAQAELADKLNRPKRTVRSAVLKPLERRGYIEPRYGQIRVAEVSEAY